MIADIKKGAVKNVLVFKLDRLTRSVADLIYLVDVFNQHDCAFNSFSESIDTQSATGRMFIKILGIFAEFERENIAERVTLGFERKAREGYSQCSRSVSYGYDRPNGEKIQTINEKEAVIVRDIFDMFLNKVMSYHYIAKNLNSRNIPTKGNSIWRGRTIKDLLTNCNYKGYVRYAMGDEKRYFEIKGVHEAIISEELFDKTQEAINKISTKVFKKHPEEDSYFAGIMFCSVCGGKMLAGGDYKKDENGTRITPVIYTCQNRYKKTCTASSSRHPKIEEAFIEYINSLPDFDTINEVQQNMKHEIKNQNLDLIDGLRKQLEKLERRERELVQSYIQEDIDLDNFNLIKTTIDKEKKQILGTIESVQDCVDEEVTIKKEHIIKNLKENWEHLNNAEKRQFLIDFVEKIEVINEKEKGKREGVVKVTNVEFGKV